MIETREYLRVKAPPAFPFDTSRRGEGNSGHLCGTDLLEVEKNALFEYMKTL